MGEIVYKYKVVKMNLENIKIESYISVACFALALFFKVALIVSIVLQMHIIYMLQQDSQNTTLFKRYFITLLANLAYIIGLAFVSPDFSASSTTFYVGLVVAVVSAPVLFIFALRFTKDLVAIVDNRLCFAIMGFVVVEFLAGFIWVLSYLWHWCNIAYSFRNMGGSAIAISAIGVFVVAALLIIVVISVDEIRGGAIEESQ